MLVAGAALMVVAGIVFAFTSWVPLLILAGAIGVISPTGNEVGPFLAIEQAALSQTIPDRAGPRRSPGTTSSATSRPRPVRSVPACSARRFDGGAAPLDAYRAIVIGYALIGLVMVVGFWRLAPGSRRRRAKRATDGIRRRLGLGRSKKSSSSCRSCSRSTPSVAASSRRA